MKIIKKGELQTIRFTCEKCGCVFEANESEYEDISLSTYENGRIKFIDMASVVCPFCKNMITTRLN